MRVLFWFLVFILILHISLDFYFYEFFWKPKVVELEGLKRQNESLIRLLRDSLQFYLFEKKDKVTGEKRDVLIKDTLTFSFELLDVFVRHREVMTPLGEKVMKDILTTIDPSKLEILEIRIYEGPYRDLTKKRIQTLRVFLTKLGFDPKRLNLVPDNTIKKWSMLIKIILWE